MRKFFKIILPLAGTILLACEESYVRPEKIYTIREGHFYSTYAVEMLDRSELSFEAKFDESAVYDLGNVADQSQTNKLLGFSDCNCLHHENSARFGWQWFNNRLEIWAYTYVFGERIEEYVGSVTLNVYHRYSILIDGDHYEFRLDDNPVVNMKRGKICDVGAYYLLFPYFGGHIPAPHEVTIAIRMNR